MRLENKVALITGGANGIGMATAQKFIAEGAIVAICDMRQADVDAVLATLRAGAGPQAGATLGYQVDVTDRAAIDAMVADLQQRFGRIDALVNNAGITRDARLVNMTEAQFDAVIDVNLKAVFQCTQAVAPGMIARGSGTITTASSVVGLYGNFGQTNYAATKFGVIGMTKTWARELGPKGVRVNAVCPGFVATHILDTIPEKVLEELKQHSWLRRLAQPAEIAGVYAFLASDDASYVNGAAIEVSGGISL